MVLRAQKSSIRPFVLLWGFLANSVLKESVGHRGPPDGRTFLQGSTTESTKRNGVGTETSEKPETKWSFDGTSREVEGSED